MRFLAALTVWLCMVMASHAANADAKAPTLLRDAEIENSIRTLATPLFEAAGLDPDAIRLHILSDPTLNAFVAEGMNMYLHTGLLIRTENANQLVGVIAHETGHIAGGHLVALRDEVLKAQAEAMVAMLLGAAAAVAGKRGDMGAGVMMGGQELAMRSLFSYTRGQEQAADQAAMRFLEATGQSSRGMAEFFEILGEQDLLVASRQDPYTRTHPLTRDRLEFVRHHTEGSPLARAQTRADREQAHQRMRAKLFAFLEPPVRTLARYKEKDTSLPARYARAIAFYRKPDLAQALPLIDGLIAEHPADPYFVELRGQMLFENGRLREAAEAYRRAVQLRPDSPLLRMSLGQVLIEEENDTRLKEAVDNLSLATHQEPGNAFAWRLLSIAHGRSGNMGLAEYAMAEHSFLAHKPKEAQFHANRALTMLPAGSPVRVRAADLRDAADTEAKKRKGR